MILALIAASLAAAATEPVSLHYRSLAPGEALAVEVRASSKPIGTLAGKALDFAAIGKGRWAAVDGFDLDVATGPTRLELTIPSKNGPHFWSSTLNIETKKFPTQELKVEEKYVTPPKEEAERAERESAMIRQLMAQPTPQRLFKGKFVSPIPGAVSSRFGERRVFNGVPKNPHAGADLRAKKGTPVKAPAAGRVVVADDLFYSGNTVIVDHGLGLYTTYAHLSRIDVKRGDTVKKGALLGLVGATGRVTGPHLHWAAKVHGARVDPFSLIALPF